MEGQRKRQRFSLQRLQSLADKHAFSKRSRTIEDARCDADLLYALFQRPHTVLPTLLPGLLEMVVKKNAPAMDDLSMWGDARNYLLASAPHPLADDEIKVFMVLIIINRDVEAHAVFKAGYSNGNLWGDAQAGCAQFDKFLGHLAQLVDGLYKSPFGEANVLQRVFELVVASKIFYLSK
jgi:hypothetical protein